MEQPHKMIPERRVPARCPFAAIANDGAQGLGQEKQNGNEHRRCEDVEEPE